MSEDIRPISEQKLSCPRCQNRAATTIAVNDSPDGQKANEVILLSCEVCGYSERSLSSSYLGRDLEVFVGENAQYYLTKWTDEDPGLGEGFNEAAFFFSAIWLGYRKMYGRAAVVYGLFLLALALWGNGGPANVGAVLSVTTAFVCGAFGNRWYLSHARNVIADVPLGMEPQTRTRLIAKRGGPSFRSLLVCFFVFLVALGVTGHFLESLRSMPSYMSEAMPPPCRTVHVLCFSFVAVVPITNGTRWPSQRT